MNKYGQSIFLVGLLVISLPCVHAMQIENGYVVITDRSTQKLQVPEELKKLNLLLLRAAQGLSGATTSSMLYVDPQRFITYLAELGATGTLINAIIRDGLTVAHVTQLYAQMRQNINLEKYDFINDALIRCGFTCFGNKFFFIHPDYTAVKSCSPYYLQKVEELPFEQALTNLGFTVKDIAEFMQKGKAALERILQRREIRDKLTKESQENLDEYILRWTNTENWPEIISAQPAVPLHAAVVLPAPALISAPDDLQILQQSLMPSVRPYNHGNAIIYLSAETFLEFLENLNVRRVLRDKIKRDGLNDTNVQELYVALDPSANPGNYKTICETLKDCGYINKAEWSDALLTYLANKGIRPDEFESIIGYVTPLNGGGSNVILVNDADALDIAAMKKGSVAYVLQELTRIKNKIAPHLTSNNEEHKKAAKKITDFTNALQIAQPQQTDMTGWNADLVRVLQEQAIAAEDFERVLHFTKHPVSAAMIEAIKRDGLTDQTRALLQQIKESCLLYLQSVDPNTRQEAKDVFDLCMQLLNNQQQSFNKKIIIGASIGIAAVVGIIALAVAVRKGIVYVKEYIKKKNEIKKNKAKQKKEKILLGQLQ